MLCPNCQTSMNAVNLDNQTVLHCSNCGSSFFEENGINRIKLESAYELAEDIKSDEISGAEKKCPKDQVVLQQIPTDATELADKPVPGDVTLLKCPKCRGIFTFPEDLIKFKKAQEVKVNYYKIWGIPLPSLQAVVVLSFVAFISATLFFRFLLFQQGALRPSQATDLIKNIHFSTSGRYGFISFKTTVPLRSSIVITDPKTRVIVQKTISSKPVTLHFLTITDIPLSNTLTYHIILIEDNGKQLTTEEKTLQIQ